MVPKVQKSLLWSKTLKKKHVSLTYSKHVAFFILVDGGWTDWTVWGACSLTCGTGSQDRTRTCTNPTPENGGAQCTGDASESQDCNTDACPTVPTPGNDFTKY